MRILTGHFSANSSWNQELRASARLCWWSPDSLEQIKRAVSKSSRFSNQLHVSAPCAPTSFHWLHGDHLWKRIRLATPRNSRSLSKFARMRMQHQAHNLALSAKRIFPCTLRPHSERWSYLVGGFNLPLWKMMEWKSVGMMTFPTEWKVIIHSCSKPTRSLSSTCLQMIFPLKPPFIMGKIIHSCSKPPISYDYQTLDEPQAIQEFAMNIDELQIMSVNFHRYVKVPNGSKW